MNPGHPFNQESNPQSIYHGLHPGVVEDTTDPEERGRCRVRLHTINGEENEQPLEQLPWSLPCFPAFSFVVPQVGDMVWVAFQGGDPRYPVYVGWFPTIPLDSIPRARHPNLPPLNYQPPCPNEPRKLPDDVKLARSNYASSGGDLDGNINRVAAQEGSSTSNLETYYTPPDTEVPYEARTRSSEDPVNKILVKTPKGHTIIASDDPECEFMSFIDRSGQEIRFDCPVNFLDNINNKSPRDIKEVRLKTQLDISKLKNQTGQVRIYDILGQLVQLYGQKDKAKILLQSVEGHYLEIDSGYEDRHEIRVQTNHGHFIILDDVADQITIQHASGSTIQLRKDGNIFIKNSSGQHEILMNTDNILLANELFTDRLVKLESMMNKFNTHTHFYIPGSGTPRATERPIPLMNDSDGTIVTRGA